MLHQNWFCKENMVKFYEYYDTELYYDTNTDCIYRVEKMDIDIHIIEIHETSDQYNSVKKMYDEYKESIMKENTKEYGQILKEKLECGCLASVLEYFIQKLSCHPVERIEILKRISDFIYCDNGDETSRMYICFDAKLDNVDEPSELHLMYNTIDKEYKGDCFVAMLDEYGNPSLYSIDIRELKSSPWKKDSDGCDYYVSPKTGWVYTFYKLNSFSKEYPNTDKICCMFEFTNEKEMLIPGTEGYEVEEIVGWEYSPDGNIPKDDFQAMIEEYEVKCTVKEDVLKTLRNKMLIDGYVMSDEEKEDLDTQIDIVMAWL